MRTPEFYYRNSLAAALRGDISEAQELKELGDVRRESFGLSFSEGASEEYPFIEEALETLLNSYEFTRCQRPDGSFYGTRGKCKKGVEVSNLKFPASEIKAERVAQDRIKAVRNATSTLHKDLKNDPNSPGYDGTPEQKRNLVKEVEAISRMKGVKTSDDIMDKYWDIQLEIEDGKREVDWVDR